MKTPNPDHPIRNTLKHLALAATMGAALYFGAAPASAQTESIPILNPSFESGNSSAATSWTNSGGFGIQSGAGGLVATDGISTAYSNGGTGSQILTTALVPNTEYTLKVDVGERTDILASFGNTAYTIGLYAGATLLTVDNNSLNSIPGGTWATSTLTYTSPASGPEIGQLLRIELSSAGIQSIFDNVRLTIPSVPPAVLTYTPPDGGTMAVTSDLVLTFNKPIAIGTGDITIKNLTDNSQTVITLPDSQVSISGAVLTINPMDDLLLGKNYAVQISAGAVKDLTDELFAGILDDTTWNFASAAPTATIVTLVSSGTPSTYGDSVTFTATVDPVPSGGTVQFYSDNGSGLTFVDSPVAVNTTTGEATVTTSTLGAATYDITADYSGNFQFAASSTAAPTTQVVEKAELTVTAQNVIRFVDTPNPAFTYQITGFQNGETLGTSGVTGAPDLSTTAVTASPVGDYPITASIGSLAADNYSFAFVDGVLAVINATPAGTLGSPQIITSDATSGISSTNTYTHAVNMGGDAVTINGVPFAAGPENGTGYSTTNFPAAITSGNFSEFPNPGDAVATMLDPFRFGNVGQTLTITGLTPGQTYDARIYYRQWVGGDNRSTLITFDEDGAAPHSTSVTVNQDATPDAFYLSYTFTATNQLLWVSFAGADGNTGNSFHISGFSVQNAGASGFGIWAATNAGGQTASEDYDNDGVANGIEYFMGETGSSFTANPSLNASNEISWTASAAYQGTYEVQTSPDLATWTNVDPRPTPSGGTLSYTLPTGTPGGKSFVRLLVTPTRILAGVNMEAAAETYMTAHGISYSRALKISQFLRGLADIGISANFLDGACYRADTQPTSGTLAPSILGLSNATLVNSPVRRRHGIYFDGVSMYGHGSAVTSTGARSMIAVHSGNPWATDPDEAPVVEFQDATQTAFFGTRQSGVNFSHQFDLSIGISGIGGGITRAALTKCGFDAMRDTAEHVSGSVSCQLLPSNGTTYTRLSGTGPVAKTTNKLRLGVSANAALSSFYGYACRTVCGWFLFNKALSDAEELSVQALLSRTLFPIVKVVWEGDSIDSHLYDRQNYTAFMAGGNIYNVNLFAGGERADQGVAQLGTSSGFTDANLTADVGPVVAIVGYGANDLGSGISNAVQTHANLRTIWAYVKARGVPLCVRTIMPNYHDADATKAAYRQELNALIRADAGVYYDLLVDLDQYVTANTAAPHYDNTDWFYDTIHPTLATADKGCEWLGTYLWQALDAAGYLP